MFSKTDICDGVDLVCVKTDSFKTNMIDISMALPMDENASANALMINLLKRSCKAYPDYIELNARLDELYGAYVGAGVTKTGDAQVLSLSIACLDDRFSFSGEHILNDCVELLASMLFSPNIKGSSFGADNLALEKRLLVQRILEEQDDKRYYAFQKCIEVMCAGEPFGLPKAGTPEQVEKTKMAEVYSAWKNALKSAKIRITAVGNIDKRFITKTFKTGFGKIEREPCEIKTVFHKKGTKFARVDEKLPVNQGKLVIGYRAGMEDENDDYYAERVMVDIFGGGTYSKLFANIREKMSLAYYCSARLIASKGIVIVQSGIDTEKEKSVSAGVINQLNEVRNGKFTDDIIKSSKLSIKESLTFTSPDDYCAWYSSQILYDTIRTPKETADNIEKVTREEICAAASRMSLDKIFMLVAEGAQEGNDEG
ncbi:MAG: insulinase family protein [Clostridia bacterium]|nr:insulinase family protein [Clostridia bacterium]